MGKTPNTAVSKLKNDKLNRLCCRVGLVDLGLSLPVDCVIVFLCPYYISLFSSLHSKVETQHGKIIFNRLMYKHFQAPFVAHSTKQKNILSGNSHKSSMCHSTDWQQNNLKPPTVSFQSVQAQVTASHRSLGGEEDVVGRRTERRRMLTHLRPNGLLGKEQQTQEPAECEQLFLARSRHGNSSSLQSRAYLEAIKASEKTRQQLGPLLFTKMAGLCTCAICS